MRSRTESQSQLKWTYDRAVLFPFFHHSPPPPPPPPPYCKTYRRSKLARWVLGPTVSDDGWLRYAQGIGYTARLIV